MVRPRFAAKQLVVRLAAALVLASAGCMAHEEQAAVLLPPVGVVPTELTKVRLPPYVIDTPDVLLIEVYVNSLDVTKPPVALWPQPITGQHLVNPDGTVRMGIWGAVPLAGLTIDQATLAVRQHVFNRMQTDKRIADKFKVDNPDKLFVVVDVLAYNSKTYYVITDGAGFGEQIYSFPITGGETVLDALARVNGLSDIASKRDIWVARRSPQGCPEQLLAVDYVGISQHAATATNYQVMPGDRIYVKAECIFAVDRALQKVLTPIERVLGITLLGASAVNNVWGRGLTNGGVD